MKRLTALAAFAAALLVALVASSYAVARGGDDEGGGNFQARLIGYNETPSVSTLARGTVRLHVQGEGAATTIDYVLTYSNIEGGTAVASHIHLGQRHTAGGVSAFFCGGGDKPPCPAISGTVTGTIDAADIIGPTSQGIEAGSIEELVRAIRAGATYANVHSSPRWPGGEIRGQFARGNDHGDEEDGDGDD
jgi:CHRD domain-containing protein